MKTNKPAVFIDRDGTINEQMGYVNHPSRFILLPGVPEAFRILNQAGFLAIILSNQSGVARGYFPIELIYDIHSMMTQSISKQGGRIDGIYFCPHYPKGSVQEYTVECDCRKPRTGLVKQACENFEIDLSRSYMIGDHYTDMELAERSNIKGILVRTGYGAGVIEYNLPGMATKPCYIADDLLDAVKWIVEAIPD
jgi:D-glycero-D-manno-heptose 1,7-bisphosphate phosphatase